MSKVKLGKRSIERLSTVNPTLQAVILKSFETMPFDITVLEGIRSKERQAELFKSGASKTMNSKHLTGNAIDIAPFPIDWNDKERFNEMAKNVYAAAKELGVKVRWGGDFKGFYDGPHIELL